MSDLLTFKRNQLRCLESREEITDDCALAIARVGAEIRALEGNADDPRDSEIASLRVTLAATRDALAAAEAGRANSESALARAIAAKLPPPKPGKPGKGRG